MGEGCVCGLCCLSSPIADFLFPFSNRKLERNSLPTELSWNWYREYELTITSLPSKAFHNVTHMHVQL